VEHEAREVEQENPIRVEQGYKAAGALMYADRMRLPIFCIVLALPGYLKYLFSINTAPELLTLAFVDQMIELAFLYYVAAPLLPQVVSGPLPTPRTTLSRLLLYGGLFWGVVAFPVMMQSVLPDPSLSWVLLLLLVFGFGFTITFFFFFMPVMLGVRGIGNVLTIARGYTAQERFLPFRVILPPLALSAFVSGIFLSPYPDGREPMLLYGAELFLSAQKVLAVYLSVAFGLVFLRPNLAPRIEVKPYFPAQIVSLSVKSPTWIRECLKMKNVLVLLLFSGLIWMSNEARLETLPPPGQISIGGTGVGEKRAFVTLKASDPEYRLRGLDLSRFSLVTPKGNRFAGTPNAVTVDGERAEGAVMIEPTKESREIQLEFETERSAEEMQQLEALELWYRSTRIGTVSFTSAPRKDAPAQ
jgi:hypothetical protein